MGNKVFQTLVCKFFHFPFYFCFPCFVANFLDFWRFFISCWLICITHCVESKLCHCKNLDGTQNPPTCKFEVHTFFEKGLANFRSKNCPWDSWRRIWWARGVQKLSYTNLWTYVYYCRNGYGTEVLFATFGPIVGMLESIPLDTIINTCHIKQKHKKVNIVSRWLVCEDVLSWSIF
jgi:hypothetical protein